MATLLLILCAFAGGAVAGPLSQREQCARHCTRENDFSLRTGNTYTYDYETTTVTAVQGTRQDKSQLQMTAQVDIEVISKCDLSLRMRGVTLKQSDPRNPDYLNSVPGGREFSRAVESYLLRFSFQNGRVEHVCPEEHTPDWVTNIHKGALSAFQTSMVNLDGNEKVIETDVAGKCTAEYQSLGRSWQGTLTLRKRKDLSTCTDRQNVETSLQGTPYARQFDTQSLPLVTGSQECEQVIGGGVLESSSCVEKHLFRPFSKGQSGVVTTVTQKLSYATVSQRTFTGNDYRPTRQTLLFRHSKQEPSSPRIAEEAESAMQDVCEAAHDDVSMSVPSKFSALVYKLKRLSANTLNTFYRRLDTMCANTNKAKKFFMDAIPLVSTGESARFMFDMIRRNEVSQSESNFWLTSLSFISEPTADMISTFTPLLDGRYEQAFLGVSALIHTFCTSHDCANVPQVRDAVRRLVDNLGENCYNSEERKILLTLKAISNIGNLFGRQDVIEACYKNPQIRIETRLAAVQAFRRVGCEVSREELMKMYSNYDEDSELRIGAYLGIMACPSPETISAVKSVLQSEKINQVGSFVWTHLTALSKSKHPERQDIRELLSDLYLMNKFQSDLRRFSSAHEANFYLQSLDSGLHVDNHVVFSTDSYIPRSASFNLTVDVFGHACNLFQIDGRMEGLERVVERFFGPSGIFPQKNIAKLLREKRSISNNKLEEMDEQFQAKSRFEQTPYASADLKIFGNTLWYGQYHQGDGTGINLVDLVSRLAENREAEYSKSFMFMDTTFAVPMASGMPLRVALNGTFSVALKVGGKFNVRSFQNVDILGHIEPSGAVEIASLLTVDAGNTARSGLRVVGTLHSSTVLDGVIEVKNGEMVKAKLNMPRDRIDIVNIKSKLFLVHGNEEREQRTDRKEGTELVSCLGRSTSRILGVELCSELRLPSYQANSPLHPVNGPASFSLYIQKSDPTLKTYVLDAQWSNEMKGRNLVSHYTFAFNTPNSQVDRDTKMELYLNQADHTAMIKIRTPIKKIGLNAKLTNEEALKKLGLSLDVDEQNYFSVQSELRTVSEKGSLTYTPSVEVKLPSGRTISATGSTYLKFGHRYSVQLQIENLTQKPILAKGNVEVNNNGRYDGEFSLSSFVLQSTIKGYVQLGDNMASRLTTEYKLLEGRQNKINIIGKMRNLSANALTKYTGLVNVQASALPEWTTEVSFETMHTAGHFENSVSVSLGDGVRSRVHTIKLQEILRYEGNLKNNKASGLITFAYPEKNINYAIDVKHENTMRSLKNSVQLKYGVHKQISSAINLSVNPETPIAFDGDLKISYPGREVAISADLSESNRNEYRSTFSVQWQEDKRIISVVHFKDKSEGHRLKYEVDGQLSLPAKSPITFNSIVGTHRGQFAGFAEVNIGVDRYRVKADYSGGSGINHRLTGQLVMNSDVYGGEGAIQLSRDKLSGSVEIKMPGHRRIASKLDGRTGDSSMSGSYEIFWDADRDPNKRFSISGEVRNLDDGYDGKLTLHIRRRIIKALLNTSLQGQLFSNQWKTNNKLEIEWTPNEKITTGLVFNYLNGRSGRQINGQVEMTSPYYGYENVSLSLVHMYANQQWSSEASLNWPRRNEMLISTSGKYSFVRNGATLEASGKIKTPFRSFRELSTEIVHNHNIRELFSKAELKWSRESMISIQASGSRQPGEVKGSLKFVSPFSDFRDMSLDLTHSYATDNYKTQAEIQWAPRRKMILNFDGRHLLSGRKRTCMVNLAASTPFRGFENTAMVVTYVNDGVTLGTDAEFTWNRNKMATGFSASARNSYYTNNVESKMYFSSPFTNFENSQVSISLELNQNSYKINVDAQMPYRSTASLNSQGKATGLGDIEASAVVIGHIPNYMEARRLSVDFVHKFQNSNLRTNLDASIGDKQVSLLLIGVTESGYKSRNVEVSATLTTPIRGYEDMKADLLYNSRGSEYLTKLEFSKNRINSALIGKLSIRDSLNFETSLELNSMASLPNAKLSIVQVSSNGQLEHNTHLSWDRDQKIHLNIKHMMKPDSREIFVKLTTPFRKYRDAELRYNYGKENWSQKVSIVAIWNRRNKLTVDGDFTNYRWETVDAQLQVTSPFSGYDYYKVAVKYDVASPRKNLEGGLQWGRDESKKITLNANGVYSRRLYEVDAAFTSPFEGFTHIVLSTKYEDNPPEKSLTVNYERERRKITMNGKAVMRGSASELSLQLSTPYSAARDVKTSLSYNIGNDGMEGVIVAQWNRNKYKLSGIHETYGSLRTSKMYLNTPHRGYENVNVELSIDLGYPKKTASLTAEWGNDGKVSISGEMDVTKYDRGMATLNFQSTFEGLEELTGHVKYSLSHPEYQAVVKGTLNRYANYKANITGTFRQLNNWDFFLDIDSPHSPFRNASFQFVCANDDDTQQFSTALNWEKKQIDSELTLNLFKDTGHYDISWNLYTPFKNFKTMSVAGGLDLIDDPGIQLSITTPFEALRKFDMRGDIKQNSQGRDLTFSLATESRKITATGSFSNRRFQPFEGSLTVDSTFPSLKPFSTRLHIVYNKWYDAAVKMVFESSGSTHTLDYSLQKDDDDLNFELKLNSPRSDSILTLKADYSNPNSVDATGTLQVFGKVHYVTVQILDTKGNLDMRVKLESPMLPERRAEVAASYSQRRRNVVARLAFLLPSQSHVIAAKYDSSRNQMSANIRVDSELLPFSYLETSAKYVNSNGRDLEAGLVIATGEEVHKLNGIFKNYDNKKSFQLKVECPKIIPITISGTFNNENFEAIDGSISMMTPEKEIRISGNMKNTRWEQIEAFLTLNTPFPSLQMLRLDGHFKNDRYRNIDFGIQVESSNRNLHSLGLTSKLSRTEGSEDISVMLHLPSTRYRTVQILATAHHNPDFSSSDVRVTLSLPPKRYSVYGQYGASDSRLSGAVELEWEDGRKWLASGRLERTQEKSGVALSFTTPSQLRYGVGAAYGRVESRHFVAAFYKNPDNELYDVNATISIDNPQNFEVEVKLATPFRNYRNVQLSLQQQWNTNYLSTNIECSKDGRQGFWKFLHRRLRDGRTGYLHIGCPYHHLREAKLSFNSLHKYSDREYSLQLDYNRVKQFKAELMQNDERVSHFLLDAPTLPLTMTANHKRFSDGVEVDFKSDYLSRIVAFRTAYHGDGGQVQHNSFFTWDERAEKSVAYDFKMVDARSSNFRGKEMVARMDFPSRSLVLKGNFTKTDRARSGGIDFYWDAGRSLDAHAAIGVEHQDLSSGRQASHRVQITFDNPKLPRTIVQTNTVTIGAREFYVKSTLQYSRKRQHNFALELRANDVTRDADTHLKADLTLRHPVSRIDVRATAEIIDTKLESAANLRVSALDRDQRQVVHDLRAKIYKLRQQIDLMMKRNDDQTNIFGELNGRNGDYELSLEQKFNDETQMTCGITFSRRNRLLDINVITPDNDGAQMVVTFPEDSVALKVAHTNKGNVVLDLDVGLELVQSRILKSRVYWQPGMWQNLRISTGESIREVMQYVAESLLVFKSELADELTFRWSLVSKELLEEMRPFIEDFPLVVNDIADDIRAAHKAFKRMYRDNEFFMQDIVRGYGTAKKIARQAFDNLMLGCEVLCNVVVEYLEDLCYDAYYLLLDFVDYAKRSHAEMWVKFGRGLESAREAARKGFIEMSRYARRAMRVISRRVEAMSNFVLEKVDRLLRAYAPFIIDSYYYSKHVADCIRSLINNMFTNVAECFTSNRYYVALMRYVDSVLETIRTFREMEYMEMTKDLLSRVYFNSRILQNLMSHPHVEYLSGVTNAALRKGIEIYHNLGMDSVVSSTANAISEYLKNAALETAQELLKDLSRMAGGAKYEFAPQNGRMSLEVNLPTSRSSLLEVFDLTSYPDYQRMRNLNRVVADYYEDFCVWDFYYKFVKYFTPSYWLPEFAARAIISGNQHYITFDKLPFEFAGRCSYLLTRDFVDGNFSVLVNYGRDDHQRKSLTILTEGRKLDIGHDHKVALDDTKVEMPVQVGETVVFREGAHIRVENDKKGFAVICNLVHNYCRVSVSGFYFGKTAGLLGTFNGEPRLDMMTPTRHLARDVESFASSWEVGQGACQGSENFATLPANDYRVQQRCRALFQKSSSQFRACFKQVNPEAYLSMCVRDLSAVHENRFDDAICTSAAAYFAECKMEGVNLKMPKTCVQCEKQDGSTMEEGDAVKFGNQEPSLGADVVFLVEEKPCNKDKIKYLGRMAQGIEDNYRDNGFREVRYSVVGFGGEGVHARPHVHTMDGQEFGHVRSVASAFQSLEYGDGPVNILEALRFAAALNFRAGAARSFILIKCSACKAEEVRGEYSEMLRTLMDSNTALHLMMEQKYEMKVANKNAKARRVIGVDHRFAYTLKNKEAGDGDLLAQLKMPKDVCVPLALEVNGSSFDSHFLTETKKNANKRLMDLLSRLVVQASERRSPWGMCCECLATQEGVGKSACQRCVSEELASMMSADTSGVQNAPERTRSRNSDVPRSRVRKHKDRRGGA